MLIRSRLSGSERRVKARAAQSHDRCPPHPLPSLRLFVVDTLVRVTAEQSKRPAGHVFISYVREDGTRVDQLVKYLERAGIQVWRDKSDIAPGQDWKIAIRRAISNGAFAFLGCFSQNSTTKSVSYQNEEVALAVEQVRRRPPGAMWFIPVRFDECTLPEFDIGGGRTLDDINRVDLFDDDWADFGTLVLAINHIFGVAQRVAAAVPVVPAPEVSPGDRLPAIMLEPSKIIALESLVDETVDRARQQLNDQTKFPMSSVELDNPDTGLLFLTGQMEDYVSCMADLLGLLIRGCAYSTSEHEGLWARVIQRIARTTKHDNQGMMVLQNLRALPLCLAVFAGGLGALYRKNYGALRAVAIDPKIASYRGDESVVSDAHPWVPFQGHPEIVNLALDNAKLGPSDDPLTTPLISQRSTPASDYLCDVLQPVFTEMFTVDEEEYVDVFDRAEVFLGFLSENERMLAQESGHYGRESWVGAFVHRQQYRQGYDSIDQAVVRELHAAGPNWPPLNAGLFQGRLANAQSAADSYLKLTEQARRRAW